MRIRGLLLCAAIVVSAVAPAKAEMRIAEDRGGQIGRYLQAFAMVRSSGERVVVDGNCLSACTLVLGVVPRDKICATQRARFGFHAAWMPNENGRPVTSRLGTQALWDVYPASVRRWINQHGGLTRAALLGLVLLAHGVPRSLWCSWRITRVPTARQDSGGTATSSSTRP